jgi:CRP-like cAMP-binding protein
VTTSKKEIEKRIKLLRDRLEPALHKNDVKAADPLLTELESLEPAQHRWPHKRGDLLRRAGRNADAAAAYERAAALYAEQGLLPRAIAMAKVAAELDPKRIEALERVDPSAARALHRRLRPEGVHVGELGTRRRVQEQAVALEAGPSREPARTTALSTQAGAVPNPAPAAADRAGTPRAGRRIQRRNPSTIDLDLSDLELAQLEQPPAPAAIADAEREACLPLLPLFAEAPKEALLQLTRESELVRLAPGERVIRRGDPSDALFGIVEGSVRVLVPDLPEAERPRLTAGDVFGEACLLSSEPRRADVVVETELLALRIPKLTLSYLVRVHEGLADVLFELMTRRLIANLLHTSGLFAELGPADRRQLAADLELRRARGGTDLLTPGASSDALFITLTGHVEIVEPATSTTRVEGAGVMFGHTTLLDGSPSGIGVRARETLLALRLPREAFTRVAMQYPAMLMRMSELPSIARVAQ